MKPIRYELSLSASGVVLSCHPTRPCACQPAFGSGFRSLECCQRSTFAEGANPSEPFAKECQGHLLTWGYLEDYDNLYQFMTCYGCYWHSGYFMIIDDNHDHSGSVDLGLVDVDWCH